MHRVADEVMSTTNTLIVCGGDNFCMMAADKRGVILLPDGSTAIDDSLQKIFKVNDSLLFGATGVFWPGEDICDPIKIYMNDRLTLASAYNRIASYFENNLFATMLMPRNYYLAGRDENNNFCIVRMWLNHEQKKVDRIIFAPTKDSNKMNFIAIPASLNKTDTIEKYNNLLNEVVGDSNTLPDLYLGCTKIIHSIADEDATNSVSKNVQFVSVW